MKICNGKLNKIVSLCLAYLFLVNSVCNGISLFPSSSTLAPPSVFQKSSPTEKSEEFKKSILSDVKFLTVTFSIASHFLINGRTKQTLVKTMRDAFRNKKEFLEGIDLENVHRKESIVYIPFERENKSYEAKVCTRDRFESLDKSSSVWCVLEKFGIQIAPLSEKEKEELYTQAKVREFIKKGRTTVPAADGEKFTFLLQPRKDIDRHAFTIIVQNRERHVGFIDIFRNYGDYSFDSIYSPFKEDALYVESEYREKYKHIGQSLISFALGLVKSNGYENFIAEPVRMGREGFFERLGFKQNPTRPRQYIFDLTSQPLPEVKINAIEHKKEIVTSLWQEKRSLVIRIPDFSTISFKELIEKAPTIDEYYEQCNDRKILSRIEHTEEPYEGQTSYHFGGGLCELMKENPSEDLFKVIKHTKVYSPTGELEGNLLIYYFNKENAITLVLEGSRGKEPILPDGKVTRGSKDWDRAVIKIILKPRRIEAKERDYRIPLITHDKSEMGLSRTMIAIMLQDVGISEELSELYQVLRDFLYLPGVTDALRIQEKKDSVIAPLSLVSKVNLEPKEATKEDIDTLISFSNYKSWAVRQLALNALRRVGDEGLISQERIETTEKIFEEHHITEDFRFIYRLLVQDPYVSNEILYNLTGNPALRDSIEKIDVQWYDKGRNKNVYKIQFILKDGRAFTLAASTIRHDPIGEGFNSRLINESEKNWVLLSNRKSESVPRLYSYRWAEDYRPRITDMVIYGRKDAIDLEGVGRNRWIYNNISVVFREFVEGEDLSKILADQSIPVERKKEATKAALQACLDIWNDSKDVTPFGLFVGDPKPANIVVYKEHDIYKAKNIDLDALRDLNLICDDADKKKLSELHKSGKLTDKDKLGVIKESIRQYPEYADFDVVYKDGWAIAISKNPHGNRIYDDNSIFENGIKEIQKLAHSRAGFDSGPPRGWSTQDITQRLNEIEAQSKQAIDNLLDLTNEIKIEIDEDSNLINLAFGDLVYDKDLHKVHMFGGIMWIKKRQLVLLPFPENWYLCLVGDYQKLIPGYISSKNIASSVEKRTDLLYLYDFLTYIRNDRYVKLEPKVSISRIDVEYSNVPLIRSNSDFEKMELSNKGTLRVVSSINMIDFSRDFAEKLRLKSSIFTIHYWRIRSALEGLIKNAMKHGNELNPLKRILITWEIDENKVKISIRDEGKKPFSKKAQAYINMHKEDVEYQKRKASDLFDEGEDLSISGAGLGIYYASRNVDKISYEDIMDNRGNKVGTEVTIVKYPYFRKEKSKGSLAECLKTIYYSTKLKNKTDIAVEKDLLPERAPYRRTAVYKEVEILKKVGILVEGTKLHTYQLRSDIRMLSPPEIEKILAISEFRYYKIPANKLQGVMDKINLFEIIFYAQRKIKEDKDFARVPVVARIVDGEGNVVVDYAQRRMHSEEKPYGIRSRHSEIEAIREAEKKGFNDWKNATLYVNLQPCYHCSRAIAEFYGFRRVVYGMEDVTLSAPDLALRILRDNGVEICTIDDSIRGMVESLFKQHIDFEKPETGRTVKAYYNWRKNQIELAAFIRRTFGDNLQICGFDADLWKDTPEEDIRDLFFSTIVWANQNMNPKKERLLLIVGSESNSVEAKAKIVGEKLFDRSKVIISRPDSIISDIIEKAPISDSIKDRGRLAAISENMERLHKINMNLLPLVENGKILWHVIPVEIIPHSIRSNFVNMINDTNRNYPDLREKIKIVTNRQYLHTVVAKLLSDSNNIVDVAVADRKDLEELPEGIKALVFEGELGDFRQLEGIIAALRALQQNNIRALVELYELLTGKPFKGSVEEILKNIENPQRLAEIIIFNLKPIEIHNYEDLRELNKKLLQFIQAA